VAERLGRDGSPSSSILPAISLPPRHWRAIEGGGGRAITAKADVSDPLAVRVVFDAAAAALAASMC
jgi:3-oxoacyl-[acyl-carrier protein] reductase